MTDTTLRSTISENSTLTIGVLVIVTSLIAGGVWWASAIQSKMDEIGRSVAKIEGRLESYSNDQWSKNNHDHFSIELNKKLDSIESSIRESNRRILALEFINASIRNKTP